MSVEHIKKNAGRSDHTDFGLYEEILLRWVNLPWDVGVLPTSDELAELRAVCPEVFADQIGIEVADGDLKWIFGIREHLRAAWNAPNQHMRDWYIYKLRDLYARAVRRHFGQKVSESLRGKIVNPHFDVAGHTLAEDVESLRAAVSSGRAKFLVDAPRRSPEDEEAMAAVGNLVANLSANLRESGIWVEPPPPDTLVDRILLYFLNHSRKALRCTRSGCRHPFFFKREGTRTQWYCSEECRVPAERDRYKKYWNRTGKSKRNKRLKAKGKVKQAR